MASYEFYDAVGSSEGSDHLLVQHTQERSCWVALPPALCSRLFQARATLPLALELRPVRQRAGVALPSDTPLYAAWAGSTAAAGCVGLPAPLARALGLAEGSRVALRALPEAPQAVSVTVEPASEDDWEVVQLNAEYLEEQLLNQVGVASLGQPLPFWVRSLGVTLKVTALAPAGVPVVRLVRGSEIYVAPRPRVQPSAAAAAAAGNLLSPAAQQQSSGGSQQAGGNGRPSSSGSKGRQAGQEEQQEQEQEEEEDAGAAPLQAVLRVQQVSGRAAAPSLHPPPPAPAAADSAGDGGQQPQAQQTLPPGVQLVSASPTTLARCRLRPGDWVRLAGRDTLSLVKFASLAASELAAPGHLALTAEQCEWAGAPPYSHIRLQRLTRGQRELILEAQQAQQASGSRRAGPGGSRPTVAGMLGKAGPAAAAAAAAAGSGTSQQQQLEQEQQQQQQQVDAAGQQQLPVTAGAHDWLRAPTEAALQRLLPVLGFTPRSLLQSWGAPRPGGLLVCGPAGSGKSAVLSAAASALQRHPECLTFTVTLSCREVSAEGTSQAQAQILPKVREALEHLPSLLVLDDLDVLCPAEAAGADGAASSADPALLAWLCDLLDHLATPSLDWGRLPVGSASLGGPLWPPLAVAATCRDAAALAVPLRAAGRLDHTVTLPPPTAESRAAILGAAAGARGARLGAQQLRQVAERADGFDAADLEVLVDRALHIAVRRQLAAGGSCTGGGGLLQLASTAGSRDSSSSSRGSGGGSLPAAQQQALQLTGGDLEAALEGFTPAAFWGTGSRRAVQDGVGGWQDVGGLEEARQALHEALELPTKYARLVAQAPLRLRTGVLLYGPPGCGKTHIVAAAVAAANVRCITVSGPELLNKYIGASEAAVRDVFRRAAAAAPSLLFFDEFDAIAPQRGHDNTGVTDRVVNQLLTELDGVEGLRGVCVVAATSRPDLIDAALLRPGRLDRLVFCGFPSPAERGAVLRALSRGVQLAPDVDLDRVGYNAEFYSGADLSALLAEAQLAAVHEALGEASGEGSAAAATPLGQQPQQPRQRQQQQAGAALSPAVIQGRHLEAALLAARPSVPEAERERLEAVYSAFRQDRQPGGRGAAAGDKGKGKLVSWA